MVLFFAHKGLLFQYTGVLPDLVFPYQAEWTGTGRIYAKKEDKKILIDLC